jgi:hypothetical protein
MITRPFATKRELLLLAALALAVYGPSLALVQNRGVSTATSHKQPQTSDDAGPRNALLQIARGATERFRDQAVAETEGYGLMFGGVSGEGVGASPRKD